MVTILASVSVRSVDVLLLREFVVREGLVDLVSGSPLSLRRLVSDVVIPSFVGSVVKPSLVKGSKRVVVGVK